MEAAAIDPGSALTVRPGTYALAKKSLNSISAWSSIDATKRRARGGDVVVAEHDRQGPDHLDRLAVPPGLQRDRHFLGDPVQREVAGAVGLDRLAGRRECRQRDRQW